MTQRTQTLEAPPAYAARANQTVAEITREPRALDVLKHAGINHCCGGALTLSEAAAAAGVALIPLLARLEAVAPTVAWQQAPKPDVLARMPADRHIVVDVRDELRRGQEPFARIMAAVSALGSPQVVLVRAPFEPLPLYHVLERRGLQHWTERRAEDDWVVWFWRSGDRTRSESIDVRGLEPPEPMTRILMRLEALDTDDVLEVVHDRHPIFLYPQLDARGFAYDAEEEAPGRIRIRIWRPGRA